MPRSLKIFIAQASGSQLVEHLNGPTSVTEDTFEQFRVKGFPWVIRNRYSHTRRISKNLMTPTLAYLTKSIPFSRLDEFRRGHSRSLVRHTATSSEDKLIDSTCGMDS